MWDDFQFEQRRQEQQAARREEWQDSAETEPVLLFAGHASAERPLAIQSRVIRSDGPAPVPLPHGPRPSSLTEPLRAQG